MPEIYTIAPGRPFLEELVSAILEGRLPRDASAPEPRDLGDYTIFVPTRRAARALVEVFWRAAGETALLLPEITPLGDVDEDELALDLAENDGIGEAHSSSAALGIPAAIAPLDRQIMLARFILAWSGTREAALHGPEKRPRGLSPAQALALARDLGALIDAAETEQVDLAEIKTIVPDDFAENWQVTLEFLSVLFDALPGALDGRGLISSMTRRNLLLAGRAERYERNQPQGPVIAAGSTGSIPATARLLKAIASHQNGAVVLPGLDLRMDEASWDKLNDAHAQYGLKQLLGRLKASRQQVEVLSAAPGPSAVTRFAVFSEALRPAETTEQWAPALAAIEPADIAAALEPVNLIETAGPREEAQTIAMILRAALEQPDRTAALITPDRVLARRVAEELRRWDVAVDDSAGLPLARSAPGRFLLALADALNDQFAPVSLLALLKHPLLSAQSSDAVLRNAIAALELAALRGARPAPGIEGLRAAVTEAAADLKAGRRAPAATARLNGKQLDAALALLDTLREHLGAIAQVFADGDLVDFATLLEAHITAAEALATPVADIAVPGEGRDTTPVSQLWAGDAGEDLAALCGAVRDAARRFPAIAPSDFPAMLENLLSGAVTRPRAPAHPRVHIWGLLEARLQQADIVVLGGLNEGTWPATAMTDPWTNRPMRAELGLQAPERRIGLAAHDFVQAAMGGQVYLTRAAKADGVETVASRWLLRLEAVLAATPFLNAVVPQTPWTRWADQLDRPKARIVIDPPRPTPPVAARPRRLSVTDIEDWLRDPYALYARRILALEPLDPLDAAPSAAERGALVHEIFGEFTEQNPGELPDDALARLIGLGERIFQRVGVRPGVAAFWWPRFQRMAAWFIDREDELRAQCAKQFAEISGRIEIPAKGGPFTLIARADRIDILRDGTARILDYKTGAVPSPNQVAVNFSPQLPLEAAIAAGGGFAGLDAMPVSELAYISLTGARPPGRIRSVASAASPVAKLAEQSLAGLIARIEAFDDQATPYLASIARDFEQQPRSYDHLARYREWSVNPADGPGS